jgi:hypothetical protein
MTARQCEDMVRSFRAFLATTRIMPLTSKGIRSSSERLVADGMCRVVEAGAGPGAGLTGTPAGRGANYVFSMRGREDSNP